MQNFTLTLTGTAPLLMHNQRLANPMDPYTKAVKEITDDRKRKTTEAGMLEIAHREWLGGMYYDADLGPVMPAMNIEACLHRGATRIKQGKNVKSALMITDPVTPVVYDGPRDLDALWGKGPETSPFVHQTTVTSGGMSKSRVVRTRPIFDQWAIEVSGVFDDELLGIETLDTICRLAGSFEGLGDFRPRYGKFTHELEIN